MQCSHAHTKTHATPHIHHTNPYSQHMCFSQCTQFQICLLARHAVDSDDQPALIGVPSTAGGLQHCTVHTPQLSKLYGTPIRSATNFQLLHILPSQLPSIHVRSQVLDQPPACTCHNPPRARREAAALQPAPPTAPASQPASQAAGGRAAYFWPGSGSSVDPRRERCKYASVP